MVELLARRTGRRWVELVEKIEGITSQGRFGGRGIPIAHSSYRAFLATVELPQAGSVPIGIN